MSALLEAFQALPPLVEDGMIWSGKQAELRARVLGGDDPAHFLNWPTIVSTMFVGHAPYIAQERAAVGDVGLEEWGGQPDTNLTRQAYHLYRWEAATGLRLADMASIVEVGAGYGAMARVAHARGFRGYYAIVDLPELAHLQRYYLSQYGLTPDWLAAGEPVTCDLLIACWSLSEILATERARVRGAITATHQLIAYHATWYDLDNRAYFGAGEKIDHLPGNYYLLS